MASSTLNLQSSLPVPTNFPLCFTPPLHELIRLCTVIKSQMLNKVCSQVSHTHLTQRWSCSENCKCGRQKISGAFLHSWSQNLHLTMRGKRTGSTYQAAGDSDTCCCVPVDWLKHPELLCLCNILFILKSHPRTEMFAVWSIDICNVARRLKKRLIWVGVEYVVVFQGWNLSPVQRRSLLRQEMFCCAFDNPTA